MVGGVDTYHRRSGPRPTDRPTGEWWAQSADEAPMRLWLHHGSERSLCSIPRQGDFPRGKVPPVKDALRSIHWKLDDRPIAMKFYEFATIDGPEETRATEMHQRIIGMATEQSLRIPA